AEGNLTQVTRTSIPDPLGLSDIVLTYQYDAAHRKRSETDPYRGTLRTWAYDPAGNVIASTRDGGTVTAEFDPLNRVTHRVVPGVANAYTPQAISDDQRFQYDLAGHMTRATNRNADVSRV